MVPLAELTQLGFACNWDPDRPRTWSHIPWNLLQALEGELPGRVQDVGPQLPSAVRLGLRAAAARRVDGARVSPWKHTRLTDAVVGAWLRREVRRSDCDAVVEIHDLAVLDRPYVVFQDLSYQVLLDRWDDGGSMQVGGLDLDRVRHRRDRQRQVYECASGVVAMSAWFARELVERSGLPPERVHVAYAGISAAPPGLGPPRPAFERRRLLFVGRDFDRKGGPLVVEAVRRLRRAGGVPVELTIAGPAAPPEGVLDEPGVRFVGPLGHEEVSEAFIDHDLFVMPSHFEAFGIAFAEALAHGLPCIARDAYAMPEIVEPGRNGGLVTTQDPDELAAAIAAGLADDRIHETARAEAREVAERFSWATTARSVLAATHRAVEQGPP